MKQGGILLDERLNELCQQKDNFAVAVPDLDHFLEEGLVLFLLQGQMTLRCTQFLLDLLDARV